MKKGLHKGKDTVSRVGPGRLRITEADIKQRWTQRSEIRRILAGPIVPARQQVAMRSGMRGPNLPSIGDHGEEPALSEHMQQLFSLRDSLRQPSESDTTRSVHQTYTDREGPPMEGVGGKQTGECTDTRADTSPGHPDVEWDMNVNKFSSGALYGGGSSTYHGGISEGIMKKPPLVTVKYDAERKTWIVDSIKAFAQIDVAEPVEEAYPKFAEADERRNNVVDNQALGVRKPPDPSGKGHWEHVAKHLLKYGNTNPQDMLWWVEGSTFYHECMHYQSYKTWFEQQWPVFEAELNAHLQSLTEAGPLGPGDTEKARSYAQFLLILIIRRAMSRMAGGVSSEEEVYAETKEKYWEKASKRIKEHFSGKKGAGTKTP